MLLEQPGRRLRVYTLSLRSFIFEGGICMKERRINHKIKWKVSKYRRDKNIKEVTPVPRSRYAEMLFREGAGWNDEQKRN